MSDNNGLVTVNITAGSIKPSLAYPRMFIMDDLTGAAVMLHFTPETARQWVTVLNTITKDND